MQSREGKNSLKIIHFIITKASKTLGIKGRKYCSHKCYTKDRFWREEDATEVANKILEFKKVNHLPKWLKDILLSDNDEQGHLIEDIRDKYSTPKPSKRLFAFGVTFTQNKDYVFLNKSKGLSRENINLLSLY